MFLLHTPHGLFYSAGKVGSQTLASIPNSKTLAMLSLAGDFNKVAHRHLIKNNDPIIFVIREPTARMRSGLYEIIAKQLYFRALAVQSCYETNTEYLQSHAKLFYQTDFWNAVIYHPMALSPTWNTNSQMPSVRWQYHVGNWLEDVIAVQEFTTSIGKSSTIVDISQLTPYLNSKGIQHTYNNDSEDIVYWFEHIIPEHHKDFFNSINSKKIKHAFNQALDLYDEKYGFIDNYLQSEIAIYQQLYSQSVKF
jgi:hypothetical protein